MEIKNPERYYKRIIANSKKDEYKKNDNTNKYLAFYDEVPEPEQSDSMIENELAAEGPGNWIMFIENPRLHRAMQQLRPDEQELLYMHYHRRLQHKEIAALRRNEILGLTRSNIFFERDSFAIMQQLAPQKVINDGGDLWGDTKEFASVRVLPITDYMRPYFERHLQKVEPQIPELPVDHGLLFFKENGAPMDATHISREFRKFIEHLELPPLRFHDLRHPYVKLATQNILTFFAI